MTEKYFGISRRRLDELIEEATVDAYGEAEEHTGLLTIIEDHVVCPFRAKVIGEVVEVKALEWPPSGYGLMAVCEYKGKTYRLDITTLEWPPPHPEGFEWIVAYLAWRENL